MGQIGYFMGNFWVCKNDPKTFCLEIFRLSKLLILVAALYTLVKYTRKILRGWDRNSLEKLYFFFGPTDYGGSFLRGLKFRFMLGFC